MRVRWRTRAVRRMGKVEALRLRECSHAAQTAIQEEEVDTATQELKRSHQTIVSRLLLLYHHWKTSDRQMRVVTATRDLDLSLVSVDLAFSDQRYGKVRT